MPKSEVHNTECLDQEIWKDIPCFESKYKVSNKGNVYSCKNSKTLKPQAQKNGYYNVKLGNKTYTIHRLVSAAFITNPNNYKCINHKNGNKQDNSVENLEWCNHSMNLVHAYTNRLNKRERPVERMLDGKVIESYRSAAEAERKGFQSRLIAKCCKGKRKHHGGYEWRYASETNF